MSCHRSLCALLCCKRAHTLAKDCGHTPNIVPCPARGALVTVTTDVDRGTMTLDCTVARRLQSTIKECVSLHPQTIREEIGMQHYQPPGCGLGTTRTIHRHFVRSAPQDATKTRLPICSAPNAHPTQRRTTAALCSARRVRRARRRTGAPGRLSACATWARSLASRGTA